LYREVFEKNPELFDPKYPFKQNEKIKHKKDNEYGEYF
jgi:hypothetical protein